MNSLSHCALMGPRCGTEAEYQRGPCNGLACKLARNQADKRRRLRRWER